MIPESKRLHKRLFQIAPGLRAAAFPIAPPVDLVYNRCKGWVVGGTDMLSVARAFRLEGAPVACRAYGGGHINRTYLIETDAGRRYILQRVNTAIFPDVSALMENIVRVTAHLRACDPRPYHALEYVPALDGGYLARNAEGAWRVSRFIEGGVCREQAESERDMAQTGVAFGRFQRLLSDFPAGTLHETIPAFHETPKRFADFAAAVRENRAGRLAAARAEADALLALAPQADGLTRLRDAGELPLRVTHNDAKLGNVILDAKTREPLCVIDLDTVMPGLVGNDFADSLRAGACPAAEDEPDLRRVRLSLPFARAYCETFLRECALTRREIDTLPLAFRLLVAEQAARFLGDYLNGDTYYHVDTPDQNLRRARTQLKLLEEIDAHFAELEELVQRCASR